MSVWKSKHIKSVCMIQCGVEDRVVFFGSAKTVSELLVKYRAIGPLFGSDDLSFSSSFAAESFQEQRYKYLEVAELSDSLNVGNGGVSVWVDGTWIYI